MLDPIALVSFSACLNRIRVVWGEFDCACRLIKEKITKIIPIQNLWHEFFIIVN
jgi:hypothetical protein